MKLEVETVIKTGRQIVQKQQTDNPKGMDEQLTALKFLYNDLGAQVREINKCMNICLHVISLLLDGVSRLILKLIVCRLVAASRNN